MQEHQEKYQTVSVGPTARGRQRGADSGGPAQYGLLASNCARPQAAALRDMLSKAGHRERPPGLYEQPRGVAHRRGVAGPAGEVLVLAVVAHLG